MVGGFLAAVGVLVLHAGFVAFGAALVGADPSESDRSSASEARARIRRQVGVARLGATTCTVALGVLVEPVLARALGGRGDRASTWSVVLALMLAVVVHTLLGELVPGNVGVCRSRAVLRVVGPPMRLLAGASWPLMRLVQAASSRAVARIRADDDLSPSARDELRRLVRRSERAGVIGHGDAELLDRAVRFTQKTAADAFTPRVEVRSLPLESTVADLVGMSMESGLSRFPVHRDGVDDVVGVVHVKDVLGVPADRRGSEPIAGMLRPVLAVPESKDLESLLAELQGSEGQFAVVVDEYGGTAGIVTLEDLIEEIVGDISDEHDPALTTPLARRWAGAHLLAGSLHRDEVAEACGFRVPEGDFETLAGFVMDRLGRVPEVGDRFAHEEWDLCVTEMDGHRVRTVQVVAPSPGTIGAAAEVDR